MINYKRVIIIFFTILFFILFLYFVSSQRFVNGMLSGYFTGVINFFILSFLVKKIFSIINETVTSKVIKMLLIYLLKILFFSFVIFLIVINREIFSIIGFLIGFTLTVIVIFIESLMLQRCRRNNTK